VARPDPFCRPVHQAKTHPPQRPIAECMIQLGFFSGAVVVSFRCGLSCGSWSLQLNGFGLAEETVERGGGDRAIAVEDGSP
jgi:hypothetical protein